MSKLKVLLPILVVIAVGVIGYTQFFGSSMPDAQPSFAEVIHSRGKVQQVTASDDFMADIATGDIVKPGSIVKTGDESSVTLEFVDSSKLLVASNSRVRFDTMLYSDMANSSETVVYLNSGSAESRVAKQNGFGARYEVRTPAMQLAVRGTVFHTSYDQAQGKAKVSVIEGAVQAVNQDDEQLLTAGVGMAASSSGKSSVQKLLPSPALNGVDPVVNDCSPLNVAWSALQGASEYRVQLLGGDANDAIVYDQVLSSNEVAFTGLPDNHYEMRVRGLDNQGIEGHDAELSFILDARPPSPVADEPKAGATISSAKVQFRWTGSLDAKEYNFQISDVEDFSRIVTQIQRLPNNMVGFSVPLPPGGYYWRIASINEHNCQGGFSKPEGFVVASPDITENTVESESPRS